MKCHSSYTITLQVFNVYNLLRNVYAFKVSVSDLPPCPKTSIYLLAYLYKEQLGYFISSEPKTSFNKGAVL